MIFVSSINKHIKLLSAIITLCFFEILLHLMLVMLDILTILRQLLDGFVRTFIEAFVPVILIEIFQEEINGHH